MSEDDPERPSLKRPDIYDALREDGASKEKAARISNAFADDDDDAAERGGAAPPYEDWTFDALYARAQELEIDGRSSMRKAELIDALRNR